MALKIDPWSFPDPEPAPEAGDGGDSIVLAGGCFWCTEAVYAQLDGVLSVRPGYAGGSAATANYDDVCTGTTGHAEAIEIRFDPQRIALGQVLKIFFSIAHDPTQVEPPGRGRRHPVPLGDLLCQRVAAPHRRRPTCAQIEAAQLFDAPLATTLEPLEHFYVAEQYHHDYARRNPWQPYIRAVATPKVEKLREAHADLLKERT